MNTIALHEEKACQINIRKSRATVILLIVLSVLALFASLKGIRIRPEAFIIKLVGDPGYKLRVRDYRIIMDIDKNKLFLLVIKVSQRRNIYNI